MFRKVFISHASEDTSYAETLYDYLTLNGFSPWLDKKKLFPGNNWDIQIRKALLESDFVIILLSSISVSKRGYIQREFKLAIQYAEEKLDDDIYIVPILLDRCQVPDSLRKYQWILADQENSLETIQQSLENQRIKYIESQNDQPKFDIAEVGLNFQSKFDIDYKCSIPQIRENKFFDSIIVNSEILQDATEFLSQFTSFLEGMTSDMISNEVKYFIEIGGSVNHVSPFSLSLSLSAGTFFGGAHPNIEFRALNLSFSQGIRRLKLSDILDYSSISDFATWAIERFSEYPEEKNFLNRIPELLEEDEIDFIFSAEHLTLNLSNFLPHIMKPLGFIDIPISEIKIKIKL